MNKNAWIAQRIRNLIVKIWKILINIKFLFYKRDRIIQGKTVKFKKFTPNFKFKTKLSRFNFQNHGSSHLKPLPIAKFIFTQNNVNKKFLKSMLNFKISMNDSLLFWQNTPRRKILPLSCMRMTSLPKWVKLLLQVRERWKIIKSSGKSHRNLMCVDCVSVTLKLSFSP